MALSEEITKSATAEWAESLKAFAPIEESVYKSDISPCHKALRSLALPAMGGVALNAWAGGGPLGYLTIVLIIGYLAYLIWRPHGHKNQTEKIQAEPRVPTRNRAALAGPQKSKRKLDSHGGYPQIASAIQSLP